MDARRWETGYPKVSPDPRSRFGIKISVPSSSSLPASSQPQQHQHHHHHHHHHHRHHHRHQSATARQFDSSVLPNPSRRDVLELANLVLGPWIVANSRASAGDHSARMRTRRKNGVRKRGKEASPTVGHAACSEKLQHPTLRRCSTI